MIETVRENKRYWPYQVQVTHSVKEVEQWCHSHFKGRNWRNYSTFFAFKRKEDYIRFMFRWS